MRLDYFGSKITALLTAMLLLGFASISNAALSIPGLPTTMQSDSDRMISYRHQEHMWQTSDGAIHVLINLGAQNESGSSLALFSSFDSGQTWLPAISLANTGKYSTSDGLMVGNLLSVVYSSAGGNVLFAILRYDSALRTWSLLKNEIAFASDEFNASNPAIAFDSAGSLWCAFVSKNNVTSEYNIKMVLRTSEDAGWQDTGLIFGSTDALSIERSARPVPITGGVGMIFTVHEKILWAQRRDGSPASEPWDEQVLFTSAIPYDTDPYASHFSIAVDDRRNLHLAFSDHGQLFYTRFLDSTQSWGYVRQLTGDISAAYVQVTTMPGGLAIFTNVFLQMGVLQSADYGGTFSYTDLLTHEAAPLDGTISYAHPRVEAPGRALGSIPVLQQYVDNDLQRLLFFSVPPVTDSLTK